MEWLQLTGGCNAIVAVMQYRLTSWQQSHGGTSFFLLAVIGHAGHGGNGWVSVGHHLVSGFSWPSWMAATSFDGSPWPSPWAPMACHTWHTWVGPRSCGATPMGSCWFGKQLPGCMGHGPWFCSSWQSSGSWWQAWWSS